MINELSTYFLNKESSLSVPMQISELVNASYKISVIDYDYVGFAKEVDYTSFAKKLFDYCKNINIHNFTFVSISREMDNKRMVKKGYKPDFNPKGLDCKMSIHHANINDGKIIFITVVSTESENVFEQIVKTMYTGTFDSGYILLPSHIPIDQNRVVDNIKKSIQIIYDRHGYVKNIYITLKDMHETSELEYISYPYGGGDFGSFLLFTLCRGKDSKRELLK